MSFARKVCLSELLAFLKMKGMMGGVYPLCALRVRVRPGRDATSYYFEGLAEGGLAPRRNLPRKI